ncbi:MAG: adenylosuccinate synthetase [Patescibacteria group bacterium]|nr:adenylosuccinate synthetase [Patescibacteria group bacterium]
MKQSPGFADVLIGLQYGDEGKAKVIDLIADHYDIIARFNGGANAGHTIETDKGRVALHQIPSGIFYQNKLLYVGSGCVVDMCKMIKEIQEIKDLGIDLKGRLFISDQASIVQPHHILVDIHTGGTIGTTKNGIGPAYADKALRMDDDRLLNIKIGDLLDNPDLLDTVKLNLQTAIKRYNEKNYDVTQALIDMRTALESLIPFVVRDTLFLQKQIEAGKRVLFEGANAIMLDITKGLVPFVTSSNTVAAAAYVGGDVPVKYHRKIIGVAKAIMSRVGNGPFVSEFGGEKSEEYCAKGLEHNKEYEKKTYNVADLLKSSNPFEIGIALRMLGNEYGSTTKRPRRIGMLDLVQIAYTAKMNGVDEIFLTKCDLLVDFAKTAKGNIPVVTGYTLHGKEIDYVPGSNNAYREVQPIIEYLPAFTDAISTAKSPQDLPAELSALLKKLEKQSDTQLLGIGTGTKRNEYVLFS